MKLSKQGIGVWVKASEELPGNSNLVHLKFGLNLQFSATGFYENNKWYYPHLEPIRIFDKVEWLKPLSGVYVLTEEELKDRFKQIAYEAWKSAASAYRLYPDNKHTFAEYWETLGKQFIESLTNET